MVSVEELGSNADEIRGTLQLGGGAQFWAYISGEYDTPARVTTWTVRLEQQDGNWVGRITSENPREILTTPNLAGIFTVSVTASGPEFGERKLTPLPASKPEVGCDANCAAMIGIVASPDAIGANYWTVWDAICSRS